MAFTGGLNEEMVERFEKIVREYQDRVFRLCYSMLRDRAAAEETAQDALLRVWKGLPGFRSESSLSTWIYTITRNACLTAMGRRASQESGAHLFGVASHCQISAFWRGRGHVDRGCSPGDGVRHNILFVV